MDVSESSEGMVRTIRLDDERIGELLDALDAKGKDGDDAAGKQQSTRFKYRIKALVVHMQQPGFSAPVPFLVPSRNISAGGVAFLHGGFVHPGTRCLVQLITSYGTWNNANGVVADCQLVEGSIHEVSVNFDCPVDPAVFCADAVRSRVLLVEDDASIARLAKFHLERLNADTDVAVNGVEAVEMAMSQAYDLILMDMEMPIMDGFEATAKLRERGYTGAIAAATALTQAEDTDRCLQAGCDKYLPKPFSREALAKILSSLRQEPLFSTLHDDTSMASFIREFVSELAVRARQMEEAIRNDNAETVTTIARALKAEGTSYGFEIITEISTEIEDSILHGTSTAEVKEKVDKLAKLCLQARAPQEAAAKAPAGNAAI